MNPFMCALILRFKLKYNIMKIFSETVFFFNIFIIYPLHLILWHKFKDRFFLLRCKVQYSQVHVLLECFMCVGIYSGILSFTVYTNLYCIIVSDYQFIF